MAAIAATIACFPGPRAEAAEGQRLVIEIRNFEFVPAAPIVGLGDVVVWKNADIVPHTVTSKGKSWNSGLIKAGGEWQTVVTDDMTLEYYCRFHPSMVATLKIKRE